ncbi:MAG: zinc ribbon domain-containing protein YjdM [Gemmataceae bacterium]
MNGTPLCPRCQYEYTYEDGSKFVCPECGHEWNPSEAAPEAAGEADSTRVWKDANGNELKDGDTVMVIKDLKVKGTSSVLKSGTKVKKIRLTDGDHDIDCRIEGFGSMKLKSEFVKKVV